MGEEAICRGPNSASLLYPTESVYLGRHAAENGNARARVDNAGARTEWTGPQAAPGLTVSGTTGDPGSSKNPTRSKSPLRKCPGRDGFLI